VKRILIAGALVVLLHLPALAGSGDVPDSASLAASQSELRPMIERFSSDLGSLRQIGRASCRERVYSIV
jgi:hypothetical protein